MPWLLYAFVSAGAAAVTALLAKLGVEGVPSTLATALRTIVVLIFAWVMVFQSGEGHALPGLSKRSLTYLALSGLATGISWLAYFRALQLGPASRVAPVDKLSLPLTVVFAALLLGESVGWKVWVGVLLMTVGALLTIA
jgi:transporter family protein